MGFEEEIASLNESFLNRAGKVNILLTGEAGSGKTFLATTCPKPVFIDSFDPGGSYALRPWVQKGEIVVDSRWENEDPRHPTVYAKWEAETEKRIKSGFFSHFKTYMLDSATTWAEAIMNEILKKAGRAGKAPSWGDDYVPQVTAMRNAIRAMLGLPCNFILTGHLDTIEDKITKRLMLRFMSTGKSKISFPALFNEIWVMIPSKDKDGVSYSILTQATGIYQARSRLNSFGILDVYEKPDVEAILAKVDAAVASGVDLTKPFVKPKAKTSEVSKDAKTSDS